MPESPRRAPLRRLVLFGASGDLAGRYLLPALAHLLAARCLPGGFELVGVAREEGDDASFRRHAREQLRAHAPQVAAEAREALVRCLRYRRGDAADVETVAALVAEDPRPLAAYLGLPAKAFPAAVEALGRAGLPEGSRIVVEKPFGEDAEGAEALDDLLARAVGRAGERAIFRVDHVLGMATLHDLLALRLANRLLEPLWCAEHVEEVEIRWEEILGLEGRASFYDRTGALADVVQNHVMQVLCFAAMEPPATFDEDDLRARRQELLQAVRMWRPDEVAAHARRARWSAGHLVEADGSVRCEVPAYVDAEGVDPARDTETWTEVELAIDTPRWSGTRFVLRAGKALARRRKEVVVRFRPSAYATLGDPDAAPVGDELRVGIDGPLGIRLGLVGGAPGLPPVPTPVELTGCPPTSALPPYARVLRDVLHGSGTLSVGSAESEQAWRILGPVRDAFRDGRVPMETYPAGSSGPAPREAAAAGAGTAEPV